MPHDLCRDHPALASSDRAVGPDCRRAQPILATEHWIPPAVTDRMLHVYGGTADQSNALGNLSGAQTAFTLDAAISPVESPGGLSPPGAPRSVREPLGSYGSRCSAVSM